MATADLGLINCFSLAKGELTGKPDRLAQIDVRKLPYLSRLPTIGDAVLICKKGLKSEAVYSTSKQSDLHTNKQIWLSNNQTFKFVLGVSTASPGESTPGVDCELFKSVKDANTRPDSSNVVPSRSRRDFPSSRGVSESFVLGRGSMLGSLAAALFSEFGRTCAYKLLIFRFKCNQGPEGMIW